MGTLDELAAALRDEENTGAYLRQKHIELNEQRDRASAELHQSNQRTADLKQALHLAALNPDLTAKGAIEQAQVSPFGSRWQLAAQNAQNVPPIVASPPSKEFLEVVVAADRRESALEVRRAVQRAAEQGAVPQVPRGT